MADSSDRDDAPTPTDWEHHRSTAAIVDPGLKVEVVRSDGTKEEVSLHDAIEVYERRRQAALQELQHCEKRIADLQKKWRSAVKGRVLRSVTNVGDAETGDQGPEE